MLPTGMPSTARWLQPHGSRQQRSRWSCSPPSRIVAVMRRTRCRQLGGSVGPGRRSDPRPTNHRPTLAMASRVVFQPGEGIGRKRPGAGSRPRRGGSIV